MSVLRVFSHGGGVQSTAALVLSAQGRIDFPVHLFANVGDDSEDPATLAYVREVSTPFARESGIELVEVHRVWADGRENSLREHTFKQGGIGSPLPMFLPGHGLMRRQCTQDWKIGPIAKWLAAHGATAEIPAVLGLGISVDEMQRARTAKPGELHVPVYPLLDLGLKRIDCHALIRDAGLPPAPKSSCYFCPYHRPQVWAEMRRDRPELFEAAAEMEDHIIEKRARRGEGPLYLTRTRRGLREAIPAAQDEFTFEGSGMEDEGCDEGVCFT